MALTLEQNQAGMMTTSSPKFFEAFCLLAIPFPKFFQVALLIAHSKDIGLPCCVDLRVRVDVLKVLS